MSAGDRRRAVGALASTAYSVAFGGFGRMAREARFGRAGGAWNSVGRRYNGLGNRYKGLHHHTWHHRYRSGTARKHARVVVAGHWYYSNVRMTATVAGDRMRSILTVRTTCKVLPERSESARLLMEVQFDRYLTRVRDQIEAGRTHPLP